MVKRTAQPQQLSEGAVTLGHLFRCARWNVLVQACCLVLFTVALLLRPDSSDVAVGCAALSILASCTPLLYALAVGRMRVLFSALAGFTLAPIWFLYLEAVLPGYDAYVHSPAHFRIEAMCWISAFVLCVNLLYLAGRRPFLPVATRALAYLGRVPPRARLFRYLTFFSFLLPLTIFLGYYGSFATLWHAISGGRTGGGAAGGLLIQDSLGDYGNLMLPISWLWQVVPFFGTVAFLLEDRKRSWRALLPLAMGLAVIFAFFLSGSRGIMMYTAAPVFICFAYFNYARGVGFWALAVALLLATVGIMELQLRFRGNLLEVIADPAAAARRKGLSSATTIDLTESHRDNNTYIFCLVLQGYPEKYSFTGFNDYFATIVNPIPRAFWHDKPVLTGAKNLAYQPRFILDGPIYLGTTSLSYSVIGEAYQARGLLGIAVYGLTYALFLLFVDAMILYVERQPRVLVGILGLGVFLAFWGVRAFFAFISFVYPFFLVLFILWFAAARRERARPY